MSDFLNVLATSAQSTTAQKWGVRKALTTPISVSATADCVVICQLTSPAAVTVNLPAGANKQVFCIVDGTGDAATNTVTINRAGSDTIAGATTATLTTNRETIFLVYNSSDTDWKIAGRCRTSVALASITGLGSGVATFLATPSSANLASALTDETGSGAAVFATSPTLVTPVLGTPSSGTLTSCTGLPISSGVSGLGTGVATFLGTPSSANLASAVTDETGSGLLVFDTSPTLTTNVTVTRADGSSPAVLQTNTNASATDFGGIWQSQIATSQDSGAVPVTVFASRISGGSALATRPIFQWRNNTTVEMVMAADGTVTLGSGTTGGLKFNVTDTSNQSTLTAFRQGSFTMDTSGPYNTGTNTTVNYVQVGNLVTLSFSQAIRAGNSTAAPITITGTNFPSVLRPVRQNISPVNVVDNGADQTVMGQLTLTTSGNLSISKTQATTNFTSTASNVGFYAFSISYCIA